jgi:hypothetical protein
MRHAESDVPRSRLTIVLVLGLLLVMLGAGGAAYFLGAMAPAPPVVPAGLASPAALSAEERRFYEQVAPVLRAAAAEARALSTQGQERSRNIFAIRAGQDRLDSHLGTLDAATAASAVPARFAAVTHSYMIGAAEVRAAMRDAHDAFIRFDWDAVGAATERMATGTNHLEAAVRDLDTAAGVPVATPAA